MNNLDENRFDDCYVEYLTAKREKLLKDKFTPKPFFETWKGVYRASTAFKWVLQVFSICTFTAGVGWFLYILFGSFYLGMSIAFIASLAIEYAKNEAYKKQVISYLQFSKLSKIGGIISCILFTLSLSMSYFGAPKFVAYMAPKPQLVNIDSIESKGLARADSVNQFYNKAIEDAKKDAKDIHKQNNWKGITVKAAQGSILAINNSITSMRDSLQKALSINSAGVQSAIKEAARANEIKQTKHTKFLYGFGSKMAIATLLAELLILLCSLFGEYYDFRSFKELAFVQAPERKTRPKEPIKKQESFSGVSVEFQGSDLPQREGTKQTPIYPQKENGGQMGGKTKTCAHCGDSFTPDPKSYHQKYCKKVDDNGRTCKDKAYNERRRKK